MHRTSSVYGLENLAFKGLAGCSTHQSKHQSSDKLSLTRCGSAQSMSHNKIYFPSTPSQPQRLVLTRKQSPYHYKCGSSPADIQWTRDPNFSKTVQQNVLRGCRKNINVRFRETPLRVRDYPEPCSKAHMTQSPAEQASSISIEVSEFDRAMERLRKLEDKYRSMILKQKEEERQEGQQQEDPGEAVVFVPRIVQKVREHVTRVERPVKVVSKPMRKEVVVEEEIVVEKPIIRQELIFLDAQKLPPIIQQKKVTVARMREIRVSNARNVHNLSELETVRTKNRGLESRLESTHDEIRALQTRLEQLALARQGKSELLDTQISSSV